MRHTKQIVFATAAIVITFFLFLAPSKLPSSPVVTPRINPFHSVLEDSIISYFQEAKENNRFVGASIALVMGDSVWYTGGFGYKELGTNDTIDSETVFRLGSLSKGFTGILSGILVQEGLISWDDTVVNYVPSFRLSNAEQTSQITLKHLLSHTSGLPYHSYTNLVEAGLSLKTIASRFNQVSLIAAPGEMYSYQNAAFALSGEMINKALVTPLSDIFSQRLFNPMGMKYASVTYEGIVSSGNWARPHYWSSGNWRKRKINQKYYNAVPAGGVNASASDMGKYLKLLIGERPDLVDDETMKSIYEPLASNGARRKYYKRWPGFRKSYYGLGWRIHTFQDDILPDTLIHHGGYVNGYRGEIALDPEKKWGLCVLFNSPGRIASSCIPDLITRLQTPMDSIKMWEERHPLIEESIGASSSD